MNYDSGYISCQWPVAVGVIVGMFKTFNETLDAAGVFANEGKMVDAGFVEVPRQRNTREENKYLIFN